MAGRAGRPAVRSYSRLLHIIVPGPLISSSFRYRVSFAHDCAKIRFGVPGCAHFALMGLGMGFGMGFGMGLGMGLVIGLDMGFIMGFGM